MKKHRGYTLIEVLLILSIATTLLLASAFFVTLLYEARIKNQAVNEVEQQGWLAMQAITQVVRNAESIVLPTSGASGSTLSLDVVSASLDPTIVDVSSGTLRMKEGSGLPVSLTNERVTVSAFSVQNVSRSGTPGIIRIQYTISSNNPDGRNEYRHEKTFITSAAVHLP